jgi:hypothetical protein
MNQRLQQFVEEIVISTKLKGRVRDKVFRELCAHVMEEEKELQLQGFGEEKIFTTIQSRWGNIKSMSKELSEVHATKYTRRIEIGIVIFMVLSIAFMFFGGCNRGVIQGPPSYS